jgi:two-component system chemotaxis sensor kinase CheA
MDVVKTQVEKLKGNIDLESVPGTGTMVRLSLPMTTAILDGMLVKLGAEPYILPMESIRELVDLDQQSLFDVVTGKPAFRHREKLYPVIDMQNGFASGKLGTPKLVALVDAGGREVALLLSSVAGQSQVVLKSLDDRLKACRGVSGAAILGDGKVALVLDPMGLSAGAVAA